MRKIVLGYPVDILDREKVLEKITNWVKSSDGMKLVVTAYSEFYVRAQNDSRFGEVMQKADLVTPDGVSVLAAVDYLEKVRGKNFLVNFAKGMTIGKEVLAGKGKKTVTGVWLFEELTKMAAEKGWKVFLLGGWNQVSARTTRKLLKRFPKLKVAYDEGEERVGTDEKKNNEVIKKINDFQPDILFVSYNPIKQEKWLLKHKNVLKAKVGIGVGGTYNEYMGEFKKAPVWMENAGLKWLWRVLMEPKRLGRIMRAVIVFPWRVYMESIRGRSI